MYGQRISIVKIAKMEGVDPGTVSAWMRKIGVELKQGSHFVTQPPLKIHPKTLELVEGGPSSITSRFQQMVWGGNISEAGGYQLLKFCDFIKMYRRGEGVEKIAEELELHRSTIAKWRDGADLPYVLKGLTLAEANPPRPDWRALPLNVSSGGNELENWVHVPSEIQRYDDVLEVIGQVRPRPIATVRAEKFGIGAAQLSSLRPELFGYLLGFMLGDTGKLGGEQPRFDSINLDVQLSTKHPSNRRLGEFVCLCANSMGLDMEQKADKGPTGQTRLAKEPAPAFRWISNRSPLLAWAFVVGLGMKWGEVTSLHQVRMEWVFSTPHGFRLRFAQGLADSDGNVRPYIVRIASVPNADFTTRLLRSLGASSAHTVYEGGKPLVSMLSRREARSLPLFNEFSKGYRYDQVMQPFVKELREDLKPSLQPSSRLGPSE